MRVALERGSIDDTLRYRQAERRVERARSPTLHACPGVAGGGGLPDRSAAYLKSFSSSTYGLGAPLDCSQAFAVDELFE